MPKKYLFLLSAIFLMASSIIYAANKKLEFSPAEKEWLEKHPVITLSVDNTYPPMNYINQKGVMDGITIDYMKLIEKKVGIDFVFAGAKWSNALASAMEHKTDGILNADALENRKSRLNFSEVYAVYSQAMVVRKGTKLKKFEDFTGMIVAAKRDTSHLLTVKTNIPGVIVYEVDTVLEGLKLVLEGKADAIFDDLVVINHRIMKNYFGGLQVAFLHRSPPIGESRIGLRNNDPLLLSILNKAIVSISETEHSAIQEKWIGAIKEAPLDYSLLWRSIVLISVLILFVVFWNMALSREKKRLKEEVLKRTEELRLTNAELIKMEKMKSIAGLAAGIAHEINNPLANIVQSCQNIQRRVSPDLNANAIIAEKYGLDIAKLNSYFEERKIFTFISAIEESSERAAVIVKNMLGFARSQGEEHTVCEIEDLVNKALILTSGDYNLNANYDFKKIKIVKEFEHDLPSIMVSETAIEQVIFNLLKNSAHAIFDKSKDKSPQISIKTYSKKNTVFVEIIDNGPGMDEETIAKAFDPFYTTKGVGKGTGLGLFVAYMIVVDDHQGTLDVESTPGQGTCIKVGLPIKN